MRHLKRFNEHTIQEEDILAKNVIKDRVGKGGTDDQILWLGDLIACRRNGLVEIWGNDEYRGNYGDPMYIFDKDELYQLIQFGKSGKDTIQIGDMSVKHNREIDTLDFYYSDDPEKFFFFNEKVIDDLLELLESGINEKFKTEALPKDELFKKTDKAKGVSLRKDKKGYYVHTHRARSKSYDTVAKIPKSAIDFIESTG